MMVPKGSVLNEAKRKSTYFLLSMQALCADLPKNVSNRILCELKILHCVLTTRLEMTD